MHVKARNGNAACWTTAHEAPNLPFADAWTQEGSAHSWQVYRSNPPSRRSIPRSLSVTVRAG